MAKDYHRRPSVHHQSSFSKQLLLVLVCFLCGYLSATVFDFASVTQWVNQSIMAQVSPPAPAKLISQQAQLPKPKLEFYTLLTKDETSQPLAVATNAKVVNVAPHLQSDSMSKSVAPPSPPMPSTGIASVKSVSTPRANDKSSYLVQIASFKSKHEADRMKASLALKGFVVNIAKVNQQNTQWYRIILGPYASRQLAEKARLSIARSEHLAGMIRRMDG